jgi:hypothetical protein
MPIDLEKMLQDGKVTLSVSTEKTESERAVALEDLRGRNALRRTKDRILFWVSLSFVVGFTVFGIFLFMRGTEHQAAAGEKLLLIVFSGFVGYLLGKRSEEKEGA